MAKEWKQLLAIPLPKKGNIKQCQNYRTTSLISQPSKMVLWVTFNWLKTRAEDLLEEEQAGLTELRLGRSTAEQIILAIMEKHLSSHSHLFLNNESRWGTTDYFETCFFHFPLFFTALWDLANSRPAHSLMLSSHLYFCLPCLICPFTVPWNIMAL